MTQRAPLALFMLAAALFAVLPAPAQDFVETVDKHMEKGATLLDRVEVRINDKYITRGEIEERSRIMAAQLGREVDNELRTATLGQMIDDLLLLQLAEREGIDIPEEQVKTQVNSRISERRGQFPSEEAFLRALDEAGLSLDAYRADLSDSIRRSVKIRRMEMLLARDVVVTTGDIQEYAARHPEAASGESIRLGMIEFEVPQDSPDAHQTAVLRAETIRTRLLAGGAFDELARQYSTHASRDKGGDMGWIARGDVPELDFLVDQPVGHVSDPVEIPGRIRVFKVLDRQSLESRVRQEKFTRQMKTMLDRLKSESIIEIQGKRLEYY